MRGQEKSDDSHSPLTILQNATSMRQTPVGRCIDSFHTQKEPVAAPYVNIASLRSKCNLPNRIAVARVHNRQIGEAIGSACVGREDPQCLWLFIPAEVAAALRAGLGHDPNQYTVSGWRSHHSQTVGHPSSASRSALS